ncbi:SDR family oxidoreductase [Arthrobacter sp. zg-Y1143]|uniref:SDR family oxidoreductase n=1 Tax=Arthrobacter sp. zg-Y1143 TaxID=3049065 RepID=UPI0024C2992F|nr:SDR family oxidoreductase [Arthrobacter sp. zg-Y1143]MDK1328104.1 SDR family oxidoreductase [Arthrobacter sp. zg-Y1143]
MNQDNVSETAESHAGANPLPGIIEQDQARSAEQAAPDRPSSGVVLVAGAGGVIGRHAADEYARRGWKVRGASRRPVPGAAWEHLSVDLLDAGTARDGLAAASDTTHLVFGAYIERPTSAELSEVNTALLRNTLDALRSAGAPLRHVTLYQGGKAYGAHLGYFNAPAKERDPRLIQPNFYYDQEDLLRQAARERGFELTVLRPEGVIGYATGNPMNLLMAIAVYAAVSRELGQPLRFPGTVAAYDALYQVTDAELLARAAVWSGSEPAAAGEIFNITNGDQFRWRQLWPAFAKHFGMDYAEPQPVPLVDAMPQYAELWEQMTERYGLQQTPYADLVRWEFADFIFRSEFDNVSSTIKARQAGFGDCLDSEDRFLELFDALAAQKIIPGSAA